MHSKKIKIAVLCAAILVVGLIGIVYAQSTQFSMQSSALPAEGDYVIGQGVMMPIVVDLNQRAYMYPLVRINTDPDNESTPFLVGDGAMLYPDTTVGGAGTNKALGNLGFLIVETNFASWDVLASFRNGGVLLKETEAADIWAPITGPQFQTGEEEIDNPAWAVWRSNCDALMAMLPPGVGNETMCGTEPSQTIMQPIYDQMTGTPLMRLHSAGTWSQVDGTTPTGPNAMAPCSLEVAVGLVHADSVLTKGATAPLNSTQAGVFWTNLMQAFVNNDTSAAEMDGRLIFNDATKPGSASFADALMIRNSTGTGGAISVGSGFYSDIAIAGTTSYNRDDAVTLTSGFPLIKSGPVLMLGYAEHGRGMNDQAMIFYINVAMKSPGAGTISGNRSGRYTDDLIFTFYGNY